MTIEKYIEEIDKDGLENVWDSIIKNGLSEVQNAGELYEIGLAHINKKKKKRAESTLHRLMLQMQCLTGLMD